LKTQLRIYFILFPVLASLGPAHPLAIVTNVLFVPLLSALAFPLSLVCFFLPPLTRIMDPLWTTFLGLLHLIEAEIELHTSAFLTSGKWMAFYVVLAQGASLTLYTWQKRKTSLQ